MKTKWEGKSGKPEVRQVFSSSRMNKAAEAALEKRGMGSKTARKKQRKWLDDHNADEMDGYGER